MNSENRVKKNVTRGSHNCFLLPTLGGGVEWTMASFLAPDLLNLQGRVSKSLPVSLRVGGSGILVL